MRPKTVGIVLSLCCQRASTSSIGKACLIFTEKYPHVGFIQGLASGFSPSVCEPSPWTYDYVRPWVHATSGGRLAPLESLLQFQPDCRDVSSGRGKCLF